MEGLQKREALRNKRGKKYAVITKLFHQIVPVNIMWTFQSGRTLIVLAWMKRQGGFCYLLFNKVQPKTECARTKFNSGLL